MSRPVRSVLPLAVAGFLSLALAGCGGSSVAKSSAPTTTGAPATTAAPTPTTAAPAATTTAPAASAVTITIKTFAFSPTPVQVKAGQTVTVVNNDTVAHTFTADAAGGFDSGVIAPGQSATVTVSGTGTVGYHCKIHVFMKGSLQITA